MNAHTGNEKTTLVLGGTGKTGRRVAERLVARGLPVRIGSRSGEPAFDWQDQSTFSPGQFVWDVQRRPCAGLKSPRSPYEAH